MRSLSWRRTLLGARGDPCSAGFSGVPAPVFSADDEAGCDGVGPAPAGGTLTTESAGASGDASRRTRRTMLFRRGMSYLLVTTAP